MWCRIQEYCEGGTLQGALTAGLLTAEALPRRWDALIGILRDIAAGMDYMHASRVCHGQLNPANIWFQVGLDLDSVLSRDLVRGRMHVNHVTAQQCYCGNLELSTADGLTNCATRAHACKQTHTSSLVYILPGDRSHCGCAGARQEPRISRCTALACTKSAISMRECTSA